MHLENLLSLIFVWKVDAEDLIKSTFTLKFRWKI